MARLPAAVAAALVLLVLSAVPAAAAPVSVGAGEKPSITVDPDGTSHVVWNEPRPGAEADITHYRRLPRGATTCANANQTPMQPAPGTFSTYSKDTGGPKILRVSPEQLIVLTHRYPSQIQQPDGQTRDRTTYTWTSFDNGDTWQGPGIGGTVEPSGDAAVVGGGDDPRIAVITDRFTAGTFLQVIPAGGFTAASAQLSGNTAVVDGTVAPDGDGVAAAYGNNGGGVVLRRASGAAEADANSYSTQSLPGEELPRLAGGPSGTFLLTRRMSDQSWLVRNANGGTPAAPQVISSPQAGQARALVEDTTGALYAATATTTGNPQTVVIRKALGGGAFDAGAALDMGTTVSQLALGAAPDGAGVLTGVANGGQVFVDAFGTTAPAPPAATPPAPAPLPPGAVEGCSLYKLKDVTLQSAAAGSACFNKVSKGDFKGYVQTSAALDLNGLELVPIGSTKIQFDIRKAKLHTTGKVKVLLRGPGIGEIQIWEGQIDLDFNAKIGQSLFPKFSFPKGPDIKGFPIDADFDVKIAKGGLQIPISLKLPKVLLGISAKATLQTKTGVGAVLDSFEFTAGEIPLGPVSITGLKIGYTGESDTWDGGVGLKLPIGTISGTATFVKGEFAGASLAIPLGRPGLLVAPQVYFTGLAGALALKPDFLVSGSATFGAGYVPPPGDVYTAEVEGKITFTIVKGEPRFQYDGTGKLFGVKVGQETAVITTDGFASLDGNFDLDFGLGHFSGELHGAYDGKTGKFGASAKVTTTLAGIDITGGAFSVTSSGFGICVDSPVPVPPLRLTPGNVHVGYTWGSSFPADLHVNTDDCDIGPFVRVLGKRALRTHQAGGGTPVTIPTNGAMELTGAGGAPDVDLVLADGTRITPQPAGAAGGDPRVTAAKLDALAKTTLQFKGAPAGTATLEARPGSPAVTGVSVAQDVGATKVTGKVRGKGAKKVLSYRVKAPKGVGVELQEQWKGGSRPLATLKAGTRSGKLRLRFDHGPKGRRTIVAVPVVAGAAPGAARTVTTYVAPARPTLGAVRKLRVKGAKATWKRHGKPATVTALATLKSGRTVVKQLPGKATKVTFPSAIARVTVTPREATGRLGKTASAKAPKPKPKHKKKRKKR